MTRPTRRTQTRIITGWPGQRAAALKAALACAKAGEKTAIILEGAATDGTQEIVAAPDISIHILAPGCMCCIGNLALRVTLARVLRLERADYLILALADASHEEQLQQMLIAPPYDALILLPDPF